MPRSGDFTILQEYVNYLNGIFNQTITDSRLVVLKGTRLIICCYKDGFLPLKLTPQGFLHFRQLARVQSNIVIIDDFRYIYSTSSDPDDEEQWVFRYEYSLHPEQNVPHAHVHVNASKGNHSLRKIHFPTGRVSIEQIIAHLILEHGVESKVSDWFKLLKNSHRGFMERRKDVGSSMFP